MDLYSVPGTESAIAFSLLLELIASLAEALPVVEEAFLPAAATSTSCTCGFPFL